MTVFGVIVLAATLAVLAVEFLRRRTRPLPAWGWLGLAMLCAAEWLMFRGVDPVATYFTPIAWTSYILIADAAIFALRGRSRLHDAPQRLVREALLSIPLWLIFEAFNLRLDNWAYIGLPPSLPARWFGYAWSFATIFPGIFLTADLIESFGWWERSAPPLRFSRRARAVFIAVGVILLLTPLVAPRPVAAYLFGLVWLAFVFLLDPVNFALGLPSLEGDLAAGRRGRLFSLLAAGWVCGWLWEFWNYWAAAKWVYTFPILQNLKIFEMPAPGFLGFLPFAWECFVLYSFAAWLLRWEKPVPLRSRAEPPPRAEAVSGRRPGMMLAVLLGVALTARIIPAGAQATGLAHRRKAIRQLETGMQPGVLTRTEARFYLAKNLRNSAQDEARALALKMPLATDFPRNPVFRPLLGDIEAKLGRKVAAAANFLAAGQAPAAGPACAARIRQAAQQSLAPLPAR